jgi:hypothetical protein
MMQGVLRVGLWGAAAVLIVSVFLLGAIVGGFKWTPGRFSGEQLLLLLAADQNLFARPANEKAARLPSAWRFFLMLLFPERAIVDISDADPIFHAGEGILWR